MRRILTLCSLIIFMSVLVPVPTFAQDAEEDKVTYEPYLEGEFSPFAVDLRRAETIFFGSLPITFAVSSLAVGAADALISSDLPDTELSLGITIGLSLTIAIVDYILGLNEGE